MKTAVRLSLDTELDADIISYLDKFGRSKADKIRKAIRLLIDHEKGQETVYDLLRELHSKIENISVVNVSADSEKKPERVKKMIDIEDPEIQSILDNINNLGK